MKREPRIRYVPAGRLPDGTPLFDLWAWGRLRAEALPLGEVLRRILNHYTPKEDNDVHQNRKHAG